MFRWRKMTWVLLAWVALIVLWVTVGVNDADCETQTEPGLQDACEVGTGIGAGLIILFGFLGFFVLGLIWLMTRPRRHCPACGRDARKGVTTCKKCGHSFFGAAAPSFPPPPPAQ